jgi:hypothetical protein
MSEYLDNKDLFIGPTTKQYGSHMVMTNVQKQSSMKYINIDTRFRDEYNYDSTTNYNITLPERINDVKHISVTNVEMPISFYNISAALGNNYMKITKTWSANSYTSNPSVAGINLLSGTAVNQTAIIIIPDGTYLASTLATAIQTAIDASPSLRHNGNLFSNLICTVDNGKIEFYSRCLSLKNPPINNSYESDNFLIEFAVDINGGVDKYNTKSKLGWLMGFRQISYPIIYIYYYYSGSMPATYYYNGQTITLYGPEGQPITKAESMPDFSGPRYVYLAIEEFNKGNQTSFMSPLLGSQLNKNIIARISIDSKNYTYGSIMPANQFNGLLLSDIRSYTGKIDLLKMNLKLLNEYGFPMNLNGWDFSFCLKVEHEA